MGFNIFLIFLKWVFQLVTTYHLPLVLIKNIPKNAQYHLKKQMKICVSAWVYVSVTCMSNVFIFIESEGSVRNKYQLLYFIINS